MPSKPLAPPPGLPSQPSPGLALADQTQAVTQAVVGHVQAMLERFEQSFECRLAQMEANVPRECSRSPLRDATPREGRMDEFSSQEDSVDDETVKVASVVHALSSFQGQRRWIATSLSTSKVRATF